MPKVFRENNSNKINSSRASPTVKMLKKEKAQQIIDMKMYKKRNSIGKTDRKNTSDRINSDLDGVKINKK